MYLAKIYSYNQFNDITLLNALSNLSKLTSLYIDLEYLYKFYTIIIIIICIWLKYSGNQINDITPLNAISSLT